MGYIALVLITRTPPTLATENGQRKVINWFKAKKINYREVDAVEDKDVRTELTAISGIKGNYPQVFITDEESETTYVGDFDEIEKLVDLDDVDASILEKNPDLRTFSQVFDCCKSE